MSPAPFPTVDHCDTHSHTHSHTHSPTHYNTPYTNTNHTLQHNREHIYPWEIHANEVLHIYKPKCIVLDLDFTLWPTFYSAHTLPPYIPLNDRPSQLLCVDKKTNKPRLLSLYPEVLSTIQWCLDHDIMVSIASKNSNRSDAQAILTSLGLWHQLHFPQIFHSRKTYHFRNLKSVTHLDYSDFMFFDDDMRNVSVCGNIGVNSFRVERATGFNGMALLRALQECAAKHTLTHGRTHIPHSRSGSDECSGRVKEVDSDDDGNSHGHSLMPQKMSMSSLRDHSSTDSSDVDDGYCVDDDAVGGGMFCI
jgi:magnesium-dependent phosphatase 1